MSLPRFMQVPIWWGLGIAGSFLMMFLFPPAGILLFPFTVAMCIRSLVRLRNRHKYRALILWRGNPANQATMRGNAPNGGLSIEERNAYRRSLNQLRK